MARLRAQSLANQFNFPEEETQIYSKDSSRFTAQLSFYKILIKAMQHQKVAIPIPETLINGFQCNSVLLCTDYESGTLMLQDGVDSSIIQESLLFFEKLDGDNKPIAVSKVEQ